MLAKKEVQDHLDECVEALRRLENELSESRLLDQTFEHEKTQRINADVHSLKSKTFFTSLVI